MALISGSEWTRPPRRTAASPSGPALSSASSLLVAEDNIAGIFPYDDADDRIIVCVTDGRTTTPPGSLPDLLNQLALLDHRTALLPHQRARNETEDEDSQCDAKPRRFPPGGRDSQAQRNAIEVANFLRSHPKVRKVCYLGLLTPADPEYAIYQRQHTGPGSLISLYLHGGEQEAFAFLDHLKVFRLAVSLAGATVLLGVVAGVLLSLNLEAIAERGRTSLPIEELRSFTEVFGAIALPNSKYTNQAWYASKIGRAHV